ncbi:hypothetical protein SESBI_12811 [Sesbania bispinosa]|nr:hypothetical protein SESBI_12811 [Sesbania bispinosa]
MEKENQDEFATSMDHDANENTQATIEVENKDAYKLNQGAWMEHFTSPSTRKKKHDSTPLSCPPRTTGLFVNLSDYEDLDDDDDEGNSNIMLDVSTKDDYLPLTRSRVKVKKAKQRKSKCTPSKKGEETSRTKTDTETRSKDGPKRKRKSEEKTRAINIDQTGKKLFHTSSPNVKDGVRGKKKASIHGECSAFNMSVNSPAPGNALATSEDLSDICMPRGKTLPKAFKTRFNVTPDMGLNSDELQVAAYIFSKDSDLGIKS